jgi:hypothetical protein
MTSVPRQSYALRELCRTTIACPSQWEGVTDGGRAFYARYRSGRLSWGTGSTPREAVICSMNAGYVTVSPNDLDGYMETEDMLRIVGTELRAGVEVIEP